MKNNLNYSERWVDIKGYENLYQVSDMGNVKVLSRYSTNINQTLKERILKPDNTRLGYLRVVLTKDGIRTRFLVHRLVALSFLGDFYNDKEVNHINHIKNDNRLVNLEFATKSENVKHSVKAGVIKLPERKLTAVVQHSLNGVYIANYTSIADAARKNNCASANILNCCKGKRHSAGGYKWIYAP